MEGYDFYREVHAVLDSLVEHGRPDLAEKLRTAELEGGTVLEVLMIMRHRLSEMLKDTALAPLLLRRISKLHSEIDKVFQND